MADIFPKDILQEIAKHINDPITFEAYSLVNKQCAQIVKNMRKDKTKEFLWNLKQHPDIYRIVSKAIRPTSKVSMTLITGKPKSGKSTLLKFITSRTKKTHPDHIEVDEDMLNISLTAKHIKFYFRLKRQKDPICIFVDIKTELHQYLSEFDSFLTDPAIMERVVEFLPQGSTVIAVAPVNPDSKDLTLVLPCVEHLHLSSHFE